jgi:polynucleotide 5'-kinase involved in rRNA processing
MEPKAFEKSSPEVSSKSKDLFAALAALEVSAAESPEASHASENNASSLKSKEGDDSYTLVVGHKNSGKTSLIMHFLNPNKGI